MLSTGNVETASKQLFSFKYKLYISYLQIRTVIKTKWISTGKQQVINFITSILT